MGYHNKIGHPNVAITPYVNQAVDGTKYLVNSGKGNLWSLFFESNAASNTVYIQIFDAAAIGDVTLGTTPPLLSFVVKSGAQQLVAPSNIPLAFMSLGCVIAATTARSGGTTAGASDKPSVIIHFQPES